ncbi:MAG: hypothetical protein ACYDDF_15200 [Thermoplasmatota archaeon]
MMGSTRALLALATIGLLVGSLSATTQQGTVEYAVVAAQLVFGHGPNALTSTPGPDLTEGTVVLAPSLTQITDTNVLYVNNTNTTSTSYAQITVASSSGLAELSSLAIGLNDGSLVSQVSVLNGVLTLNGGSLASIGPSSTNTITVTLIDLSLTQATTLELQISYYESTAKSAWETDSINMTIQ